jgi:hypothetical protein
MSKSRGTVFLICLFSIPIILGVCVVTAVITSFSLGGIALVGLGSLLFFHCVFYFWKKYSTVGSVRAIEYIYVVAAILGISSIVDDREAIVDSFRVSRIETQWCYKLANGVYEYKSTSELALLCELEAHLKRVTRSHYGSGQHQSLKKYLDKKKIEIDSIEIHDVKKEASSLMNELWNFYLFRQDFGFSDVDPKSADWIMIKVLAKYLVVVAVSLKIAKTTAEILRWHV